MFSGKPVAVKRFASALAVAAVSVAACSPVEAPEAELSGASVSAGTSVPAGSVSGAVVPPRVGNSPVSETSAVSAAGAPSPPSGVLVCWGRHRDVVFSAPGGVFSEVSVGVEHACGVRADERVVCWGSTGWRQPVDMPPEGVFTDFTVAFGFGCGVRVGGYLECWGEGFTTPEGSRSGVVTPPGGKFVGVEARGNEVCGLRPGGEAVCWGNYEEGVVDEEEVLESQYFYLLPPGGEFVSILAVIGRSACGLRPSGEVECWWGEGKEGEPISRIVEPFEAGGGAPEGRGVACGSLPNGLGICFDTGEDSADVEEVTGLIFGYYHECGLRPSGEAVCKDREEFSYRAPDASAVEPPGGVFTALTAGAAFTCGLRPSGEAECWGQDTHDRILITPPEGVFTKIDAGFFTTCGLRPEGELECWGLEGSQSRIVPPSGRLMNIHAGWGGLEVSINGGYFERGDWGYSCGLRASGEAECWGDDPEAHISWEIFITRFPPEGEFAEVGAGEHEACGLRPTGVVECWGPAWVNFDDGSPTYDVRDGGGEGYTALSVGGEYSCALRSGGAVDCWNTDRSTTYQLEGPYTAVSAGYGHQCGVLATGDIHCWEGSTPDGRDWDEITFPASGET